MASPKPERRARRAPSTDAPVGATAPNPRRQRVIRDVLMIGIATSVFTAVTLTRMWVAGWLRKARPTELVL